MTRPGSALFRALLRSFLGDLDLLILTLENEIVRRGLSNPNRIRFSPVDFDNVEDVWNL